MEPKGLLLLAWVALMLSGGGAWAQEFDPHAPPETDDRDPSPFCEPGLPRGATPSLGGLPGRTIGRGAMWEWSRPEAAAGEMARKRWKSCALAGSSGALLHTHFGAAIDSHEIVARINEAPTATCFDKYVGRRTTLRILNHMWGTRYGNSKHDSRPPSNTEFCRGARGRPLEEDVVLITTRSTDSESRRVLHSLSSRPDVTFIQASGSLLARAKELFQSYRLRLLCHGVITSEEGERVPSPSSGFVALYVLMQMCDEVSVYGFGAGDLVEMERGVRYHYWSGGRQSMYPGHSYDLEQMIYAQLEAEGDAVDATITAAVGEGAPKSAAGGEVSAGWGTAKVRFCSYKKGDNDHNENCGKQG